jgi:Spy/CpxP family protein refolding chaperone
VARLQGDLEACMSPAREIEQNLLITLADGIAQGAIDTSRVAGITDSLEPAVAAEKDCSASALDQLHAVLSPSERAALVDKVRANFEVWREMNHQERAAADGRPRRLSRLARELSLTSDQVDQIQASLPLAMSTHDGTFDKSRAEQRLTQFSTAFLGDGFEARSIPSYANTELGTYGAKRMVLFYESVTPVLTPPQRQQLAEQLREQASRQPAVSQK